MFILVLLERMLFKKNYKLSKDFMLFEGISRTQGRTHVRQMWRGVFYNIRGTVCGH